MRQIAYVLYNIKFYTENHELKQKYKKENIKMYLNI